MVVGIQIYVCVDISHFESGEREQLPVCPLVFRPDFFLLVDLREFFFQT